MVTFVQATFVLVTFFHIRNISASYEMPTVTVTFAQAIFVLEKGGTAMSAIAN